MYAIRSYYAYFSGIRAATYEEDFVIRKGKWTKNIVHAAGIQSPGITAAPAIAVDVAKMAADVLSQTREVKSNPAFNPIHKSIVRANELNETELDAMIRENPDYSYNFV